MLSIKSSVKSELKLKICEIYFVLTFSLDMMKQKKSRNEVWRMDVYADAMTHL